MLRVAEALGPKLAATDKAFRARIARLKFTREQQRALLQLTPGAAVRCVQAGRSPAEFFRDAVAAGRILALLNTRADQVIRALGEYEKAASSAYRSLSAAQATEARCAKTHLHCVLVLGVNQSFASVQEGESAVLHNVLGAELHTSNIDVLFNTFLTAVAHHFGASYGTVFVPGTTDRVRTYECAAALTGKCGHSVTMTREAVTKTRKLRAGGKSLAVESEWPDVVWSVPVGAAILQLGFEAARPMLPREAELLNILAERCGVAAMRLTKEAQTQQMSVRMLEVEELERRRISRELHDDAAQALAVIRLHLEMAEFSVPEESVELRGRLAEMRELTERTIRSVRGLISELSPAVLEQLGLAAAVRQLANRFQVDRAAHLRLHIGKLPRMHPRLEVVIYRVLQECLRNIGQHSQAEHINVSLTSSDGTVRLEVEDDGIGFDVEEAMGRRNCYGLAGIRERVNLLGGSFALESAVGATNADKHPKGTKLMVEVPFTGDYPG